LPAQLQDYVIGNDNEIFYDDDVMHFAIFVNCDHISYQEAATNDC
jgi:hypothetical protein